jgi:hypothetical protein
MQISVGRSVGIVRSRTKATELLVYDDRLKMKIQFIFSLQIYAGCFKKSFTNLKASKNVFRGHVQCFEMS